NKIIIQRGLVIFIGLLLAGSAFWCGLQAYQLSTKRARIKEHYSILNNITFGLLSVDAWRDHVSEIISNRIEDFEFTPAEKDTLEYEVSSMLHALIDEADRMLDKKPKKVGDKLKRFAVKTLVNEDDLHKKVPEFSAAIVKEISRKKHRSKLKFLAQSKLDEAESITYDSTNDTRAVDALLKEYGAKDITDFNDKTEKLRDDLQTQTYRYTYTLVGLLVICLAGWWLLRKQRQVHTPLFIVSVILALVVLLGGLTLPMIEIDARIKELSFTLIGEQIRFNDQVIFYQSKSIVDVVTILIRTAKIDSVIVGILILAFSILFPFGKLLATQVYLLGKDSWKNKRFIQYFAFKSGKWSMADVNVVAIFMAYIGFNGILDSQLAGINVKTESLATVSTNQTSLQPGFILFVSFVLFSLILSEILHRTVPPPVEKIIG
ncbi:MAG TPA: paraquat-inducible protein A, partial [Chryseosolibacter sp.]|nr:paraquat-inducible protein A [Chryseosolibacter sp.]